MASTHNVQKIASRIKQTVRHHAPASTAATAVEWVAMDGNNFMAQVMATVIAGAGVTAFTINAATDSSGSNSTVILAHAVGSAPDAEGDSLVLEVSAQQIAQQGAALSTPLDFTHVSAVLTKDNNGDKASVTYTMMNLRNSYEDMTADNVA